MPSVDLEIRMQSKKITELEHEYLLVCSYLSAWNLNLDTAYYSSGIKFSQIGLKLDLNKSQP